LGARVLANHHVVGLLRYRAGDPAAQAEDEVSGLVPRQGAEATRQDERLAFEGLRPLDQALFLHHYARLAEALDGLPVAGLREEARHGLGDLWADAVDLVDLVFGGGQELVYAAEARCEELGGALARRANAKRVQVPRH